MKINNKIIALLPMKKNSERVPNKNLKEFHGKPLFHWIIETLLLSNYIEKIVINTDSEQIKIDAVHNFGNKICIIDRPKSIQGDFVSMNNIIEFDLSKINYCNHFLQTHSTNPLLKTATINRAIEKYFEGIQKNMLDSLFSVTRFQTRFYWESGEPINHNANELIRTQDLPIMYEENSNIFIFSRNSFISNGMKRIGSKPFLFETDKVESIDIDEPIDFAIAETFFNLVYSD